MAKVIANLNHLNNTNTLDDNQRKCHLIMLLNHRGVNGNPPTQGELEDEAVGLLTGYDNVSTSMTWLSNELAHNRDVQMKVCT